MFLIVNQKSKWNCLNFYEVLNATMESRGLENVGRGLRNTKNISLFLILIKRKYCQLTFCYILNSLHRNRQIYWLDICRLIQIKDFIFLCTLSLVLEMHFSFSFSVWSLLSFLLLIWTNISGYYFFFPLFIVTAFGKILIWKYSTSFCN